MFNFMVRWETHCFLDLYVVEGQDVGDWSRDVLDTVEI
jgi:hypothetical protein